LKKNKKLKFQTKKNAEMAKNKKTLIYFCSFLLVFGAVSMLILLKAYNFDLSTLFNGQKEEITTTSNSENTAQTNLGNANFLVCCFSDETDKDIRFIAVINANMKEKSFKVCTLNPNTRATVQGTNSSFSEHFKAKGPEQLVKAVETFGGIKISRYAMSTDSGFIEAVRFAGRLNLTVPKKIQYKDLALILSPQNNQPVSADNLLKYMRFNLLPKQGDNGLKTQAEVICAMLDQYINEYNAQQGDALFSRLINLMAEKNITIVDYENCKDTIDSLASSKDKKPAKTDQLMQGFNN